MADTHIHLHIHVGTDDQAATVPAGDVRLGFKWDAERHKGRCPRIKAIEFREGPDGTSIRYEYFPPAEFMIYAPDEPDTDYRKQYPFDLASAEARLKDGT